MDKIKIGIIGFGNVGKAVLEVIHNQPDMELVGVFTRRDPKQLHISDIPAFHIDDVKKFTDRIDVMILCSGSATDLPTQGPEIAKMFNTIDSFDTHAKIPMYYESMNNASIESKKVSIISTGWDPGLFSIHRLYGEAFLPQGKTYTFWGPGVSQGHSQAIRTISGVKKAVQYTMPVEETLEVIRYGETPDFSTKEKHTRVCYIVAEEGADGNAIEVEIKTMPNYFADYDTFVNFISEEEFDKNYTAMPHAGVVITSANTGEGNKFTMEFSHKVDSNPEFTANIMLAFARAAYKLYKKGEVGARTVFDIPPAMLSSKSTEELRKEIL